jgi:phosphoglycolate phosphatase-like HAD superfamily hydrolase
MCASSCARVQGAEQCELHPGLVELLDHLDASGCKKAIITRNSGAAVNVFLDILARHTRSRFDQQLVLTRDHHSGVKPHAAPTLFVCQVRPLFLCEHCWMLE